MNIDGAVIHYDEHGKCGLFSPRHFLHQIAPLTDSSSFFPCFSFSRDSTDSSVIGFRQTSVPCGAANDWSAPPGNSERRVS